MLAGALYVYFSFGYAVIPHNYCFALATFDAVHYYVDTVKDSKAAVASVLKQCGKTTCYIYFEACNK